VQRFRAALLALGLVALLAGMALGVLATQAVDKRDHDLGLAGASRVTAVDDYADRARAVTLLASHSAAFANFYQAPGSRLSRIAGRTGEPDLMPRVITALTDLENLFPDSIASAAFIDRSGAENARVVGKSVMKPDELVADRSHEVFFDRAFQLPYDKVYQSAPYRSASTGDWVIANAAKVNIGLGVSPAIVSFEITLESIRLAAYSENSAQQVRVVDLLDGRVVVDSKHPQDVNAPLGRPDDHSLRWVQTARDGVLRTRDHMRHVVRHARRDSNVATTWAVVVSTPAASGAWSGPFSAGPLGVAGAGVLLLFLSMVGYIRHGRSMHRAARRDELTGLANRRAARECAETMLARERGLAVILFDLDRFKHVNDSLGHHAGDHLLSVLGQRLAEVVREPDDVVARLGGDEFVVFARGMHNQETIGVLCERLTRAVSAPVTVDGIDVSVGVSIGIALAPEHGTDYGTLLQCADIAMYDAKGRRAGWQVYRDELAGADRTGLVLDADLRRAVVDGELTVHYQPIFAVAGGELTGVEALVRWEHPQRGLLMPGEFVPFAENTGAIKAVTGAVLELVLDQVVRWREVGIDVPVAVNVSAYDVNDPNFADRVAQLLAGRGLDGSSLVVELTETALLADPDAASVVLWRLAQMGVRVAIDDFGSGYASLLYLRRFPVSVLKLDRSLVQGLTVDPTDAALVHWTIEMAHALRVTCIAEGVEDVATLEALEGLGCDQAQGYYLQVPVGAEDLALDRAAVRP
jgi:diguanylate cyclase (GGDEF)-like protein